MYKYFISVGITLIGLSSIAISDAQVPTSPKVSLWNHNGSTVYLIANGSSREFRYKQPRQAMLNAGALPDALLFRGDSIEGQYIGTAFIFNRRCGKYAYPVRGPILNNHERVVLQGRAPRVGPNCDIQGYITDTLDFTYLRQAAAADFPIAAKVPPSIPISRGSSVAEIQLKNDSGIFVVPVEINGAITLDFIVDSGATDVAVPADVVSTLIRTGTIQPSDFIGQQTYILADGSKAPSHVFIIRSLKVGNHIVENVRGSIAPAQGSLLLGQSFLKNFNSWAVDNAKHVLILK